MTAEQAPIGCIAMIPARFRPMVAAAERRPALWRLLLGAVTAVLLAFALAALFVGALGAVRGDGLDGALRLVFAERGRTPASAVALLALVAWLGVGTLIAARVWQGRHPRSLIGPGARTLRHFAVAAGVTWAIVVVASLIPGRGSEIVPNLDFRVWLRWLPVALVVIAAQTGAEELFFRSYLLSQLAARLRRPAAYLGLSAAAFGAAHFSPALPGSNNLIYVGFAFVFALMTADLTVRTGSLGAAWGFHFANNVVAVLIVATEGSVTGLGLYRSSWSLAEPVALSPWMVADFAMLVLVWWLIRQLLAR